MTRFPPVVEDLLERFRRVRHAQRGWPLFLLSAPLPAAAIAGLATGDLRLLAGSVGAWAIVVAAAVGARRGFAAEAHGATPPRGFRIRTAVMVGLGTAAAAFIAAGHTPLLAALFGLGAAGAVRLLYGAGGRIAPPDEREQQATPTPSGDIAVLAAARVRLSRLEVAATSVRQREFAAAIGRIARLGRLIVAEAEADPADLRRVRRFLGIYLEGAERVVHRYVETHRGLDVSTVEPSFVALLDDLERAFATQHAKLKESDLRALDIEIEVLQQRLREEGMPEGKVTG